MPGDGDNGGNDEYDDDNDFYCYNTYHCILYYPMLKARLHDRRVRLHGALHELVGAGPLLSVGSGSRLSGVRDRNRDRDRDRDRGRDSDRFLSKLSLKFNMSNISSRRNRKQQPSAQLQEVENRKSARDRREEKQTREIDTAKIASGRLFPALDYSLGSCFAQLIHWRSQRQLYKSQCAESVVNTNRIWSYVQNVL